MIRSVALLLLTLFFARIVHAQGDRLPEASRLSKPPGVTLVLSGGGAKGFAHIGVLEILDSARVPIDLIVGTSIGAAIGGLYAAGYTPRDLEAFATTTNWPDILDLGDNAHREERIMSQKDADRALLTLRFTGFLHPVLPQAISGGQRLTMLLNSMVLRAPAGVPQDFLRDLRVPFIAVTTDIVKGERVLLTKGDLTEALRASATLPLTFSPLPQDSTILMDGGLLANIPVDVARGMGATDVIVSNATAPLRTRDELNTPWDVADQVISLMMEKQYASQLAQADVVITPHVADQGAFDAASIAAEIESGRTAARAMLASVRLSVQRLAASDQPRQFAAHDTVLSSLASLRVFTRTSEDQHPAFARETMGQPLVRMGSLVDLERQAVQYFRAHGYSLARVDSVVVHPQARGADLFVDEGTIARVQVRSTGEVKPATELVRSELPFSTGDIFHAAQADRALKNLTGTGLYDFAVLEVAYDSQWPGTRVIVRDDTSGYQPFGHESFGPTIVITVHERASNVIRLGGLADNEFGTQFSAELANENIGGSGIEYALIGSLGPLSRSASLTLDAPRLLSSFALLEANGYSGYIDIPEYSQEIITSENRISSLITDDVREEREYGIRLKAGGQVERLGEITGEVRGEQQRWFSLQTVNPTINTLQLTAIRGELIIDSRNDDAYPHDGIYARAYAESGQPLAGAGQSYTKLYGEIEQAIPLSALHVVIPRVRAGFADAPLPRLEQFDLGGMESFYGLNQFELRGRQLIEGSLTYQIEIPRALFFPTFVSARYDIGATWPEPTQIKWETLVDGLGAQVGLKTPFGLARFGIGENFRFIHDQPHPLALNSPRFYFSIGSSL